MYKINAHNNLNDRTLHLLPEANCKLQVFLNDLNTYANEHQMKIIENKSKIIVFNNATKYDFLPELYIIKVSHLTSVWVQIIH